MRPVRIPPDDLPAHGRYRRYLRLYSAVVAALLGAPAQAQRAVAAFRELRARKKNPPWPTGELVQRLRDSALVQSSIWLNSADVAALV